MKLPYKRASQLVSPGRYAKNDDDYNQHGIVTATLPAAAAAAAAAAFSGNNQKQLSRMALRYIAGCSKVDAGLLLMWKGVLRLLFFPVTRMAAQRRCTTALFRQVLAASSMASQSNSTWSQGVEGQRLPPAYMWKASYVGRRSRSGGSRRGRGARRGCYSGRCVRHGGGHTDFLTAKRLSPRSTLGWQQVPFNTHIPTSTRKCPKSKPTAPIRKLQRLPACPAWMPTF